MPPEEISPEAAYQAAMERLMRTTEALVLSEGAVKSLRFQLAGTEAARAEAVAENERLRTAPPARKPRKRKGGGDGRSEDQG